MAQKTGIISLSCLSLRIVSGLAGITVAVYVVIKGEALSTQAPLVCGLCVMSFFFGAYGMSQFKFEQKGKQ